MNIATTKLALTRMLLDTNDKEIINYIKAIFETRSEDWWDTLPDEIKSSVQKGMKEADSSQGVPHEKVMKRYKKWLKK